MDQTLQQQIDYYRARAGEYDEWFARQGRYDRGPELNQRWFDEAGRAARDLDVFAPNGNVLELACGTGLWTQRLLAHADRITAVDASPEVIELNRQRLSSDRVTYVQHDLFAFEPEPVYDVVFFSFWLSHVPPARFDAFWRMVERALVPGGRFFVIDSLRDPTSTATDHRLPDAGTPVLRRRLNDGREFDIYKVFYEPDRLRQTLEASGWQVEAHGTGSYFLVAHGGRANSEAR